MNKNLIIRNLTAEFLIFTTATKSSVKSLEKSSVNIEDKIKRVGSAKKGYGEMNYE